MRHAFRRSLTAGVGVAALVAASLAATPFAAATTVTAPEFGNPGFESPTVTAPFQNFPTSSTIGVNAWTVTAGNVDVVTMPYPVRSGRQALDLNGFQAGQIRQTFAVHPGLHYGVGYWVNTNGGTHWNLDVSSNGVHLANSNGLYTGGGTWQQSGPSDVVPSGTTMTVTLTSLDAGAGGVVLDDFTVTFTDPGPLVTGLAIAPNGATAHLTGTAAVTVAGQGTVTQAQYRLSRGSWTGPWVGMRAVDGAFNAVTEAIAAEIRLVPHVGSYTVCVRATDALGLTTDTPVCLVNAFTVNVVVRGQLVAHSQATTNSATDKRDPDYVVKAVAGMVGTAPVGSVVVHYRAGDLRRTERFVPSGTAPFAFFRYGTGLAVDMRGWVSSHVTASSLQFLGSGALAGYPRGGMWMTTSNSPYALPASTLPVWGPGVPFDRGNVTVWSAS